MNPRVALLEKRYIDTKVVINVFVDTLPFIESIMTGDVKEPYPVLAWNPLFQSIFPKEEFQELLDRGADPDHRGSGQSPGAGARATLIRRAHRRAQENSPVMNPEFVHKIHWRFYMMMPHADG